MPSEQINMAMMVYKRLPNEYGTREGENPAEAAIIEHARPYIPNETLEDSERLVEVNSLHLHWSREGSYAQASIRFDMKQMAEYVDNWREHEAKNPSGHAGQTMGSIFVDFHRRQELTKLAEVAKRARNKTFGD